MMRSMRFTLCTGQSAWHRGVVGQLGMEMIPLCPCRSLALTSGTTSGTSGSMRQAELSSMATAPAFTAYGISVLDTSVVAEKKVRSTPRNDLVVASSTSTSHSPTVILRPTERGEASRRSPLMGKLRCTAIFRNSCPTSPVAPTTATLYSLDIPQPLCALPLLLCSDRVADGRGAANGGTPVDDSRCPQKARLQTGEARGGRGKRAQQAAPLRGLQEYSRI